MDLPQYSESGAQFSPDGRLIAYSSDETGRAEIYVATYPQGGRKWAVSADGGTAPRWRADGRELFYRSGKRLIAVDVEEDEHRIPRRRAEGSVRTRTT